MSRWRPERLSMGIDADGIAMSAWRGRSWQLAAQLSLDDYRGASEANHDWAPAVSAAMAQTKVKRGVLDVTLADALARYWLVDVPDGISSLNELRALAASRFEALFGEVASQWHIEADWHASGRILAVAVPRALTLALGEGAARAGWRLDSVVPAAVRTMNRHAARIPDDAWLVVFGRAQYLAVLLNGGVPAFVRQLRCEASSTVDDIVSRLETECLRGGYAMPAKVVFGGAVPFAAEADPQRDWQAVVLERGLPDAARDNAPSMVLALEGART